LCCVDYSGGVGVDSIQITYSAGINNQTPTVESY